jgi:hypothetical protein
VIRLLVGLLVAGIVGTLIAVLAVTLLGLDSTDPLSRGDIGYGCHDGRPARLLVYAQPYYSATIVATIEQDDRRGVRVVASGPVFTQIDVPTGGWVSTGLLSASPSCD